jgi:hypothetical protein
VGARGDDHLLGHARCSVRAIVAPLTRDRSAAPCRAEEPRARRAPRTGRSEQASTA